jgi:hypothetical protein
MTQFFRAFVVCALFAGVAGTATNKAATSSVACSGGAGTDRLCADDYLYVNQYIVSPSQQYRMYFNSDGSTTVREWNGSTYAHLSTIHGPTSGTPGYLYFGGTYGWWFGALTAYDSSNQNDYIIYEPSSVQAEISARLENDGCLRLYEQGTLQYGPSFCP